ncbi:hypothetical protein AB0C11_33350 [Streptomyces sp. NPDC039016]|uniref:hypothetical protein n=1 Tax=Streptomyces sp. NPDC039016 TaxID=3154330 RepID=UPI00340880D5
MTQPTPRIRGVHAVNDIPGEIPHRHPVTSLIVDGEDFTPGGKAHFVFRAEGRTLAQGTADVKQNGLVSFTATVRPTLECESSVSAVGEDRSSGKMTDHVSAEVVCPQGPLQD